MEFQELYSIWETVRDFAKDWCFPIGAMVGVLGILLFGPNYKQRLTSAETKIEVLESRDTITVENFIYQDDSSSQDVSESMQSVVASDTAKGLEETMRSLPQYPLGENHTYASLPDGTNIVSMADGTYRLAVPKPISAKVTIGPPESTCDLAPSKQPPKEE